MYFVLMLNSPVLSILSHIGWGPRHLYPRKKLFVGPALHTKSKYIITVSKFQQNKYTVWLQGSKSSVLRLISGFFPTPRTILEISVNLKRKFLWGWGCRGLKALGRMAWATQFLKNAWKKMPLNPHILQASCLTTEDLGRPLVPVRARYKSREHPHTFQSFFKIWILIPGLVILICQ